MTSISSSTNIPQQDQLPPITAKAVINGSVQLTASYTYSQKIQWNFWSLYSSPEKLTDENKQFLAEDNLENLSKNINDQIKEIKILAKKNLYDPSITFNHRKCRDLSIGSNEHQNIAKAIDEKVKNLGKALREFELEYKKLTGATPITFGSLIDTVLQEIDINNNLEHRSYIIGQTLIESVIEELKTPNLTDFEGPKKIEEFISSLVLEEIDERNLSIIIANALEKQGIDQVKLDRLSTVNEASLNVCEQEFANSNEALEVLKKTRDSLLQTSKEISDITELTDQSLESLNSHWNRYLYEYAQIALILLQKTPENKEIIERISTIQVNSKKNIYPAPLNELKNDKTRKYLIKQIKKALKQNPQNKASLNRNKDLCKAISNRIKAKSKCLENLKLIHGAIGADTPIEKDRRTQRYIVPMSSASASSENIPHLQILYSRKNTLNEEIDAIFEPTGTLSLELKHRYNMLNEQKELIEKLRIRMKFLPQPLEKLKAEKSVSTHLPAF